MNDLAWNEIIWGAPDWTWPALAIGVALALLVFGAYLTSSASTAIRSVCAMLKLTAVALLAFCLLQPMHRGNRPRPQANLLPIVVDNSESMRIKADSQSQSRHQRVMSLVDPDATWRTRVAQFFDVRPYAFDSRLQNLDEFSGLQGDGQMSSMAGSMQAIAQRFSDRPVAGLVLFSDGNLTDTPSNDFQWKSLGFPVYPVVPAKDSDLQDLRIADINVRQTDFESAPTTLTVGYDAIGFDDQPIIVRLADQAGKMVQEQTQASSNRERQQVAFRFRPDQPGISFYTVSVKADGATTTEATQENNQRVVALDRAAGPYRILYIAGRPNWEFKFLRRALQEEAEIQLVGLIRIAKQEPKFSFRDNQVSDTNPLFSGLGQDHEETAQQYDEPVIIRLGINQQEELSDGFPKTDDELFAYHGVILDDLESEFFTQDQLVMLRRFVGSRGGGLLMLGGAESFAGKAFGDSPLGELAPVYPKRPSDDAVAGPYRIELTREGLLQPWARLRETEQGEKARMESMPRFATLNHVGDPKPGAIGISSALGEGDQAVPAMVTQRFGKGRTAAILVGDLWRWSMRRESVVDESSRQAAEGSDGKSPDDPAQAWRQITRWLVNDVPRRAEIKLASDDHFQTVTIVVRARDESYLPMDNATIDLKITPPSGEPFSLTAEMDPSEQGAYRATCWSRDAGGYRVDAIVQSADGSEVGVAAAGWAAQPMATELANLRTNRELLERIAQETGGQVIVDTELDRFAAELPTRKVPVTETWIFPIWHRPWVMITAMLCLCGEWGLRRWKGLA